MTENKKKICPICGKEYEYALRIFYDKNGEGKCIHDELSNDPLEVRARRNREATAYAYQQAALYARTAPKEEKVIVHADPSRDIRGNPIPGGTAEVPKKVFESIREKTSGLPIEEQ